MYNLELEDHTVFSGPFVSWIAALYYATKRVAGKQPEIFVTQLALGLHWPADGIFEPQTMYVRPAKNPSRTHEDSL